MARITIEMDEKLKHYVREKQGVLTVGYFYVIKG